MTGPLRRIVSALTRVSSRPNRAAARSLNPAMPGLMIAYVSETRICPCTCAHADRRFTPFQQRLEVVRMATFSGSLNSFDIRVDRLRHALAAHLVYLLRPSEPRTAQRTSRYIAFRGLRLHTAILEREHHQESLGASLHPFLCFGRPEICGAVSQRRERWMGYRRTTNVVEVAHAGAITAADGRLGVAKSIVSRRLLRLQNRYCRLRLMKLSVSLAPVSRRNAPGSA